MERPTSSKDVQIRQLLLLEHRSSHKPNQALKNVKAKIGQCDLNLETVKFWFNRFDKGNTSLIKAKVSVYAFPQIVSDDKYLMNENCKFLTVSDPLMNNKIVSNDGRIGLIMRFKKFRHTKLFVIDLLHGNSREVYKAGCLTGIKEESTVNHLALVDEEHVLVFNDSKLQLSLLKFDSESWQFKLCSQVNVERDFEYGAKLMLDELNKYNFTLSGFFSDLLLGSVVKDTIVINRQIFLQGAGYHYVRKYAGNKLIALFKDDIETTFLEWDLTALERTLSISSPSKFDTGELVDFAYSSWTDFVWHEGFVYIAAEFPVKLTKVYAFNVESTRWTDTKIFVMGHSTGMSIDENNVLVLKVCEDESKGINNFYRFPLKKPESLMNLAWLVISRSSTVFGNKLFDNFADRLPYICELRSLLPEEE